MFRASSKYPKVFTNSRYTYIYIYIFLLVFPKLMQLWRVGNWKLEIYLFGCKVGNPSVSRLFFPIHLFPSQVSNSFSLRANVWFQGPLLLDLAQFWPTGLMITEPNAQIHIRYSQSIRWVYFSAKGVKHVGTHNWGKHIHFFHNRLFNYVEKNTHKRFYKYRQTWHLAYTHPTTLIFQNYFLCDS